MERVTKNWTPEMYADVEKWCRILLDHLAEGREIIEVNGWADRNMLGWGCVQHDIAAEMMRILVEKIAKAEPRIGADVLAPEHINTDETGWWPFLNEDGTCDG